MCCALGAKQYASAVTEKKQWLLERMEEGLVFYRLNERAKVFIEYIPANNFNVYKRKIYYSRNNEPEKVQPIIRADIGACHSPRFVEKTSSMM